MGDFRRQNPAATLREIFISARNHEQPANPLTCRQVWAKVFSITGKDDLELAHYLSHLLTLLDKTESLIKVKNSSSQELLLRNFPKIRMGLKELGPEVGFKAFLPAIQDSVITELEFCENELGDIEKLAEDGDLKKIDEHVNSLFKKVKGSSLRADLKETLLSLLEVMRQAIKKYQIFGASALEEGLEITFGRIYVKRSVFQEIKEQDKESIDSLLKTIVEIEILLGKISKYKSLIENAMPILLGGT